jgi:hypothetical protein
MEVIIASSLLGVGYLLNNDANKYRQFDTHVPKPVNRSVLQKKDALTSEIYSTSRMIEAQKVENNYNKAKDAINTNIIPNYFNEAIINNQTTNIQYLQRPVSNRASKPKKDSDPIESFFQPLSQPQPGYTNAPEVFSPLTGTTMNFSHNNQVPFFKGSCRQNMDPFANQALLENFGGINTFKMEKKPVEPMFKPNKDLSYVNGTPNQTMHMMDRIVPSIYRTMERPTDSINVGPGLNQGFTANPTGGFQQFDIQEFALPKTTDEIRTLNNPKLTFEGRTTGPAGARVQNRGLQGVVKHRHPDRFFIQKPDRYLTTTAAFLKPKMPGKFDARATARQDSVSYEGVAGPAATHVESLRPAVQNSTNINFTTDGMRNASLQIYGDGYNFDHNKSSFFAYPNERQTTEDKSIITNLTTVVKALIAPLLDIMRISRKENVIENPNQAGFFSLPGPKNVKVYDPNDVARTTLKETNIHNTKTGNMASNARKTIVFDPNDVARTTLKETNLHNSKTGNMASNARKPIVYDPNDVARTTIKETNLHNSKTGNMASNARKPIVYDPNDVARTTLKETNVHNNQTGNYGSVAKKPTAYDPNDVARTTIKETNVHNNQTGNYGSVAKKPTAYDPNDVAKTTIKETNIHNNKTGNLGNAVLNKTKVYDPNDVARTTIKETNIHNNHSGNLGNSSVKKTKVYDPNDIARTTVKETNINNNRTGSMSAPAIKKPTVHDPNDIARTTIKETNINNNRTGNLGTTTLQNGTGYETTDMNAPNTNRQFTSDVEYIGTADGQTGRGAGNGYQTADVNAPNTNRQFTSDFEYQGPAKDFLERPMDDTMWDNASLNITKTGVSQGRYPTLSNTKLAVGGNDINMEAKKLEGDRVNQYSPAATRLYTQTPSLGSCTVTTDKDQLPSDSIANRINPNILTAFKNNPYTQPLDSF